MFHNFVTINLPTLIFLVQYDYFISDFFKIERIGIFIIIIFSLLTQLLRL